MTDIGASWGAGALGVARRAADLVLTDDECRRWWWRSRRAPRLRHYPLVLPLSVLASARLAAVVLYVPFLCSVLETEPLLRAAVAMAGPAGFAQPC
ncbi:hypothetical protein [Streptomyces sp. NPDC058206]|uniref:hypothetical protein n=1 Tax=Streptomyces sp. NPDC058206 TaxID=3346382 RepID=UPI0036E87B54